MADDTAKLVLSLEARFDKFEKEMKNATKVVDQQTKLIEQRMGDMVKVIENKLAGIKGAFIGQAGTLGQAVAALGPVGVAAAVGIGALVEALNATAAAAERVGQKAVSIRAFSVGTGFSVEEVQGIRKALIGMGQDADQVQGAIQKFTIQLHELQTTGKGPLAEALRTVDQRLVGLMINAGSTKEAFDILMLALSRMDTTARNALARSSAGRGGIGAFAEITADFEKFKRLYEEGFSGAQTNAQINATRDAFIEMGRAQTALSAARDKLFPTSEYMRLKTAEMVRMTEVMRLISEEGVKIGASKWFENWAKTISLPIGPLDAMTTALKLAKAAWDAYVLSSSGALPKDSQVQVGKPPPVGTVIGGPVPLPLSKPADEAIAVALQAKAVKLLSERVETLGNLKKLQGELDPLQARELANLEKQLELANTPNATVEQRQAVTRAIQQNNDAYNLLIIATKEALGVATQEEIQAGKTIAIKRAQSQGIISNLEAERAATIAAKEAREKYEAQLVRASSLPGLQRTALDLNNTAKQLDAIGGKALETFSDNMADAILGTKSFADAFKSMSNIILKEMIKISIQKAIIGPLFSGLSGILPIAGKMAGGPVMAGTPYIVGERGPEIMVPNTNGNILPNSALQRSGSSIIYSPQIDARGASVEAVARLAQVMEQDRATFESRTIATIQQARRGRVPGL